MNNSSRVIFMTGGTGVLGREMVAEILKNSSDRLFLLVRRKKTLSHWARIRKILAASNLEVFLGTRVHVVEGDVTFPGLGLSDADRETLIRQVTHVFHVAALTTLNASREDCERINLGGTEEVLKFVSDLKKRGKLERFFYFSTAYVAGSRQTYCSLEDELPSKPVFANFYESSKYAAETRVRQVMKEGLPVTIFRPSIVVGDSRTGEVGEFNVIYPFMKMFAHGILKKIPTHPENSVNIVPIDFVIAASLYISTLPESIGKTYHLVTQKPPTIGMILKMGDDYPSFPPIEVIPPEKFQPDSLDLNEKSVYQMLEPYMGYLNDHLTFDTTNTKAALSSCSISFPKTDYSFLKVLTQYAVDQGYLLLK